jgi:DNA adenine methylase
MSYKIEPFVKWAGGKRQLLERLESRIPGTYNRYYEPFVGGGALLLDVQPENAVINDTNRQLLNVYRQIKENPEAVIAAVNVLDSEPCDKERYLLMRTHYNAKIQAQELDAECAALMIWVNKHCFNGLYRVNSKGLFNVPYNNKVGGVSINEDNLKNIGAYLQERRIEIREGDFEKACEDVQTGDFVYFDSPYVPVSQTANFTGYTKDGFTLDDHKRLAALFKRLDGLGAKLLLSNHDVPLIHELYEGYRIESVPVRRGINRVASKRSGKEVIVTNF